MGISVSTINRGVKEGTFPPKHKLSAQRIGFLKYQIDEWIDGKKCGRRFHNILNSDSYF